MEFVLVYILSAIYVAQYVVVMYLGIRYAVKSKSETIVSKSISVVIPFKNEAERIDTLIDSINAASIPADLNVEFIFVNDQSKDGGVELIENKLKKPFRLVSNSGKGKKAAIATAVDLAKHEYILSWDADISFDTNYFDAISRLEHADMWILPVKMSGKSLIQRLGSLDFSWLQIVTYTSAKSSNPILANGANLLFKKAKYSAADEIRKDKEIASGDDVFLLEAFKRLSFVIRASNNPALQVCTAAPESFKALRGQRKRWSGKIQKMSSGRAEVLLTFFLATQFFMIGSYYFIVQQQSLYFLIPIAIKFVNEYIITQFYTKGRTFISDILVIFIAQFWYPVYAILATTLPVPYDDRWSE